MESTAHMTYDATNVKDERKIESTIGVAKLNSAMKSTSIGKLEFQECKLEKVMVVPEISVNLLSVREITKYGGEVIFTGN